jgi:Uma2 family endonuclease
VTPDVPETLPAIDYEQAAQDYLNSLPLEHFMEATPQATQREITLASLELVRARRPNFHLFNELLVQYPRPHRRRPGQVVPDNMVVVSDEPVRARTSYNLPHEAARPFWVLEYVSKSNRRKDYDDNLDKYEQELKVPYYLLFNPEVPELTLFRHDGRRYASVPPAENGRHPIPELEIEVALLDGWVRYWYQGELLPLPAEMQRELDEARRETARWRHEAEATRKRLEDEQAARRALEQELAALRARLTEPPTAQ